MDGLQLFVWDNVLHDYTAGIMFALAADVEAARALIREACPYVPEEDLAGEPKVFSGPVAFLKWGGA